MSIPTPNQVFPSKKPVLTVPLRSTRSGGEWHHCRLPPDGICPTHPEIDRSFNNVPVAVRELVRAQFESKWDRAIKGDLKFGSKDDVGEVFTRPPVLFEMRVNHGARESRQQRRFLFRLYFAEPIDLTGVMLALKFGRKPGDGDTQGVQQSHIEEAGERFREGLKDDYLWGYINKSQATQ
ncbi:hypothetical protein ACNPM8_01805 [Glutamicibacter sp. AGC46]